MQKRTLATLALPLGLAACGEMPLVPEQPPSDAVAAMSDAASTIDAVFSADAVAIGGDQVADVTAALADARGRLLPAVEDGAESSPLHDALRRLSERLEAGDAAGALAAADDAEAALATVPAADAEALLPEMDALRLALDAVRQSTGAGEQP